MQCLKFWVFSFVLMSSFLSQAQDKVLWLKIEGEIDPRNTRYVKLALQKGREIGAKAVLAEINTFGG